MATKPTAEPTFSLVDEEAEREDDQKVIEETKQVTQTSRFTVGDIKREIEQNQNQIGSLTERNAELQAKIDSVSTSLSLTVK